jgi:hypothetical protein
VGIAKPLAPARTQGVTRLHPAIDGSAMRRYTKRRCAIPVFRMVRRRLRGDPVDFPVVSVQRFSTLEKTGGRSSPVVIIL